MSDDHKLPDAFRKSYAYAVTVVAIRKAWLQIYGEPIDIAGSSSEGQFRSCLMRLKEKLSDTHEIEAWRQYLDLPENTEVIAEIETQASKAAEDLITLPAALARPTSSKGELRDIDDVTPNEFRAAVYNVAKKRARPSHKVDVRLPEFLRECILQVCERKALRSRINIGPNRHFRRMFEWLSDIAEYSCTEDGHEMKLMNASGRGRVALDPFDPKTLKIRLDFNLPRK